MVQKTDIVIATIPKNTVEPMIAPALLKPVIEGAGFVCKYVDWNLDLWKKVRKTKLIFLLDPKDLTFVSKKDFEFIWEKHLSFFATEWIKSIRKINPRWIGFGLYSNRNVFMTEKLLKLSKKLLVNTKIVIGGPEAINVGKKFIDKKLIDAYVSREGENPIVEILKGKINVPGVNGITPEIFSYKKKALFADYSDYALDEYPRGGGIQIMMFFKKIENHWTH